MKLATLLVLSAATLVGCSTPEARQRQEVLLHRQHLEERARIITVDSSDGVSEEEAYKIGKERFDTYQTRCGIVAAPIDSGDYWRVLTYVGPFGMPFEDILIRKSDGSTTITRARLPEVPNQQGGANGRQPFGSGTDSTSGAATSRRSP